MRALRRLVTALTVTLILGVAVVAGTMTLRIAGSGGGAPAFDPAAVTAERIALPEGETIRALGAAGGALMVATADAEGRERLRLFDARTGAAGAVVAIDRRGP